MPSDSDRSTVQVCGPVYGIRAGAALELRPPDIAGHGRLWRGLRFCVDSSREAG